LHLANNFTGASITPPMVSYYIKTINEAFTFYVEDIENGSSYIQQKLEGAYTAYFDIIILKENVTTDYYLYSIGGSSTVAWTSVNTARPNWTYIINAQSPTFSSSTYINSYVTGAGIPVSKVTVITNVIR
jgi:hypothetical protein